MIKNKIKEAVETLCLELKNDASYYIAWQANIAMAFKDVMNLNMLDVDNKPVTILDSNDLHRLANEAANNFLQLLIK